MCKAYRGRTGQQHARELTQDECQAQGEAMGALVRVCVRVRLSVCMCGCRRTRGPKVWDEMVHHLLRGVSQHWRRKVLAHRVINHDVVHGRNAFGVGVRRPQGYSYVAPGGSKLRFQTTPGRDNGTTIYRYV